MCQKNQGFYGSNPVKTYTIKVPILAIVCVKVDSASSEDALSIAVSAANLDDVEEWCAYKQLTKESIFLGNLSGAKIIGEEFKYV